MTTYKTSDEIRRAFVDYFARHNHKVVASSSLIPIDDPTLFFTNAGMIQFKNTFLGKEKRKYTRAVSVQRCLRASGKHNDLENVGYTTRHHTFFEMLGNFSFGYYFKQEAIHYAWDFLTKELGIDPKKLWITIHHKDKETEKLWQKEFEKTNSSAQGLSYCDDKDNFWSMGEIGPCGYCSEIFYDHGEKFAGDPPGGKNEGERYVEIWNLVFMQFDRDAKGNLIPLPKPSIDTGMGLERIAAVMQNVHDNYKTDTFVKLHSNLVDILVNKLNIFADEHLMSESFEAKIASRVVSDHIRAAVFLIADGVLPSNEKSGYVLRSIIRRAVYYLYRLGVRKPAFFQLVGPLIALLSDAYPQMQLGKMQNQIEITIEQEEIKFLDTLDRGLKILEQEISKLRGKTIPGDIAFTLHDTYGLPIILTSEIARERSLSIDQIGFEKEMEKQRETSRAASKFETPDNMKLEIDLETTEFIGYTQNTCNSKIYGIFKKDGAPAKNLNTGDEGIIVLEKTPFYAESGGQIGDTGEIYSHKGNFIVQDTQKYGHIYIHLGYMASGSLDINEGITAEIDAKKRQMTCLNHSTTHLLHNSLRLVLGEHAVQRGSSVDSTRLRFDFTNTNPLTKEELREIEYLVNSKIRAVLEVKTAVKSIEEAKNDGAFALFGEKYGEKVRVVTMGDFSKELCGGTHVNNTGEIGLFKITNEIGIAAGMRRIEAATGNNALIWVDKIETELKKSAQELGVGLDQVVDKIEQISKENRARDKELSRLQSEVTTNKSKDLASQAININGVSVLSTKLNNVDSKVLRQTVDALKQKLGSAIVVVATTSLNKVQLTVGVTKDLISKIKANELLQHITDQIDGSGGGREDMAQGGGNNVTALQTALDSVLPWAKNKL
ncbi:MAG: alanine--tRNA ligase [Gammaproteobacteria bacterium]|nr:alanine--tRNA ligase [Gammaproteobacteria bacterium]